jgi:formamidopyrimidine-DNA glycosylase
MPELPEVEVSRQGLLPLPVAATIAGAVVRTPRLRHEIPAGLDARLAGLRVETIRRAASICCSTARAPMAAAG